MKKYNKTSKSLLAVILTLSMVVSIFSGVIGTLSAGAAVTVTPGKANNTLLYRGNYEEEFGPNLLMPESFKMFIGGKRITEFGGKDSKLVQVIKADDGANHADLEFSQYIVGENTIDLTFPLQPQGGDIVRVKGFAFQGISSNNDAHYTAHYQVFVSEEQEDLYNPQSMVYEYNANDGDPLFKGVIYPFAAGTEPQGNYVGLRVIDTTWSAELYAYLRISLFRVWGERGEIPGYPGNLAENMPIYPNFVEGETKTQIPETNLTANETRNLSDADEDTYADITTNGEDKMEIIYNLCNDMNIDSIWGSFPITASKGFKKLKIYAASGLSEVNAESSLVYTYDAPASGTVKAEKTFPTQLKARYVRFLFEGCKDGIRINELYVNGLDNQKMKTRRITSTLGAPELAVTRTQLPDGEPEFISPANAQLEGVVDGDAATFLTIEDIGVIGKHKYDLTITLTDLRTVSEIQLKFLKNFEEFWCRKINIYVAETEEESKLPDVVPDAVVEFKDITNANWTKIIRPTLGRYVRLEFIDFEPIEYYGDKIITVVPDVIITGTKVRGMQTADDDERLITFAAPEHNAKVTIMRLDQNDVFTDAATLRLTPETATNWQMRSLEQTPYLKVLNDKTVYKMELLDIYGNVVQDFGGRQIQLSFKIPEGYENNNALIGDATDRKKITVLDAFESGTDVCAMYTWVPGKDNKIALLGMTTGSDPYWSTIGELEDFPEEEEEEEEEEIIEDDGKDEEWYKWIRTSDDRFAVATIYDEIKDGIIFNAQDISATAPDSLYEMILQVAGGKKIAAIYDMELVDKDGNPYDLNGDTVDIKFNLPDFIYDNFTDLQIIHIDDDGYMTALYSEITDREFYFQTNTFSNFAIIGTALDGSSSLGLGAVGGNGDGTLSPETGETVGAVVAAFLALLAAGYVAIRFGKAKASN